mmetsp:Transcript_6339/g.26630  ORF Transcript_6339/g.26630 Transcript_6339/m.26630 type:complete len:440 (+) Transcript_6339:56-1375(+)
MQTVVAVLALFGTAVQAFQAPGQAVFSRAALRQPATVTEAKKSVEDLGEAELKGKKVLIRCDLNVPLDGKTITDDTRIRASVPTVKYLLEKGASVAMCSHLGRPKEGPEDKFSLAPVATRMAECLGQSVTMAPDCIGDEVKALVDGLGDGEAMLLENTRFYKEEEKNDPSFVEKLAAPFDLFVNDAFGTAHRAHASTEGVTAFIRGPKAAGFLMEKELQYIKGAIDEPQRPLTAILGGAKVSTKIPVIESMLDKCDSVLVGGGMIFTFYKAQGLPVGASLVEDDMVETAGKLLEAAKAKGVELLLPTDVVVAEKFDANAASKTCAASAIPDGWLGLDVGPETVAAFSKVIAGSKTVVWNGPMGVFEFDAFAKGTFAICDALADMTEKGAITIIGGGDSVAAVEKAGLADKMSHISTGGGASLELLEGKVLPGVAALDEA